MHRAKRVASGDAEAETAPGNAADCTPSDQALRNIVDTATDGIVTLGQDGEICSFSAGAEALFGMACGEVIGRPFADLLVEDSRPVFNDYLDILAQGGMASILNDGREVTAHVKLGGPVNLFLTIGRLESERTQLGLQRSGSAVFCVVLRDITAWKETEKSLRASKEKAERLSAKKSMFLANISHELRTPLNAIMGFSEVMRSQRFGEMKNKKYLGYANDIHASGEYLLSLINDLLDLSKIDAGKLELNFTSVSLVGLVDDAIKSLAELAEKSSVTIKKSVSNKLPNVVADLRAMRQVLLNVLSNAVKFTPAGGRIIISAKLDKQGQFHLIIKDTGRGMSKQQIAQALEPFQQVGAPDDTGLPGTGLGLPLAKALTQANRASFKISSKPKKGTKVEIVFPTPRVLAE